MNKCTPNLKQVVLFAHLHVSFTIETETTIIPTSICVSIKISSTLFCSFLHRMHWLRWHSFPLSTLSIHIWLRRFWDTSVVILFFRKEKAATQKPTLMRLRAWFSSLRFSPACGCTLISIKLLWWLVTEFGGKLGGWIRKRRGVWSAGKNLID